MNHPRAERFEDRYQAPERAAAYSRRSPARHEAEMAVLDRALGRVPGALTFLDLPAGTGRVSRHLEAAGHRVVSADVSAAMLRAEHRPPAAVVADALRMPFPDEVFDAVLCFRFIYHLDGPAMRARLLHECARVSRRFVLVSFRHPISFHAIGRRLKNWRRGEWRERRATGVRRLAREAAGHGLRLRAADAQAAYRKEFWLATFEKCTSTAVEKRQ